MQKASSDPVLGWDPPPDMTTKNALPLAQVAQLDQLDHLSLHVLLGKGPFLSYE